MLIRSILIPLRKLIEGTERISQGDLSHRVNQSSQDEIGDLARAFDRMAEKRQQAHEAMREAVNQISAASAEILAGTTQQASGAQEQAAAVAQTMTTVNEVTQTADQAAQRAKTVGESVQRTLDVGKAGQKVVEDSLIAMETVKEKVETTAENIIDSDPRQPPHFYPACYRLMMPARITPISLSANNLHTHILITVSFPRRVSQLPSSWHSESSPAPICLHPARSGANPSRPRPCS